MSTYERATWVDAPLDDVWAFHAGVEGLVRLTPDWMNLRVESVTGPDGDPRPAVLAAGTTIEASVRPFDVGPRQRWTSRVAARERDGGDAYFRDVMTEGPFPEWEHTHLFYGDGDRTLVRDRVRYRPPVLPLPGAVTAPFFEPMFRYRHRRTRELLPGT